MIRIKQEVLFSAKLLLFRDESGAKIRIEGSSPQERIITVDGPTDSIFKVKYSPAFLEKNILSQAYTLICKILEERELRDNR